MTRLILTTSDSGAGALQTAGLADCVIGFGRRFVSGQLQSPNELERSLAPRDASSSHWLDNLTDEALDERAAMVSDSSSSAGALKQLNCGSIRIRMRS